MSKHLDNHIAEEDLIAFSPSSPPATTSPAASLSGRSESHLAVLGRNATKYARLNYRQSIHTPGVDCGPGHPPAHQQPRDFDEGSDDGDDAVLAAEAALFYQPPYRAPDLPNYASGMSESSAPPQQLDRQHAEQIVGPHAAVDSPPPARPTFTSVGQNVIIKNLPSWVTAHDVLKRVCGGAVKRCCLTKFKPANKAEMETLAVVMFKDPNAAERYTKAFSRDSARRSSQSVWELSVDSRIKGRKEPMAGTQSAWIEHFTKVNHHLLVTHPTEVVLKPLPIKGIRFAPTRCLVVKHCSCRDLRAIWKDFGFDNLTNNVYHRSQIEDIWFDNYKRDGHDLVVSGDLHMRFTSIDGATNAKESVERKAWARADDDDPFTEDPLRFETDPCEEPLSTLDSPLDCHPGYLYLEGQKHLPLLCLSDWGSAIQVLEDWHKAKRTATAPPPPISMPSSVSTSASSVLDPGEPVMSPIYEKMRQALQQYSIDLRRSNPRHRRSLPAISHPNNAFRLGSDPTDKQATTGSSCLAVSGGAQKPWSRAIDPGNYLTDAPFNIRVQAAVFLSSCSPSLVHGFLDSSSSPGPSPSSADTHNAGEDSTPGPDPEPEPTTPPAPEPRKPNYARKGWGPGSVAKSHFWAVSVQELRAMSDEQWKAFGTVFYVPPAGFDTEETSTAEKHVTDWATDTMTIQKPVALRKASCPSE